MNASYPIPVHALFQNLIGKSFGEWTVESYAGKRKTLSYWNCRCRCGGRGVVYGGNLTSGKSTGCIRCFGKRRGIKRRGPRWHYRSTHSSWTSMKRRCLDPECPGYGQRGIKVCQRWLDSFTAFLADMGPRPSIRHSIDRIDSDGNYEPGNCRWATDTQQARNQKRNHLIEHNGKTKCLAEWAEIVGLPSGVIRGRLSKGWTVAEALTTPARVLTKQTAVTINGETKTLLEWCAHTGLSYSTLHHRIKRGWPFRRLFSSPRPTRRASR